MSYWQIRIQDPSGETRVFPLVGTRRAGGTIGAAPDSEFPLRDLTAPPAAARVWVLNADEAEALRGVEAEPVATDGASPFWIRVHDGVRSARMGDWDFREAQLPSEVPLRFGESTVFLERADLRARAKSLPTFPDGARPWLTQSPSGFQTLWTTRKAAATPLSIYLEGETGTGKEVLAQLIHAWSDRAAGPFVPINCGALPFALAESELFGHVKGAYTGAEHQRAGAFLQAHGGTLFLDEIGDLPLDIQVKLLRFLENGEIRPVGADRYSRANVRMVCATHQPLERLVDAGKFRRDLYYRLASVTVTIPSLRSRPEDIELLAQRYADEHGKQLSSRAKLRLQAHTWPGNVRELRHAIERAAALGGPFTSVLDESSFQFLLTASALERAPELELGAAVLSLHEMERVMLRKALRLANGNRSHAARILGVARSTVFEMIKRHGIESPRDGAIARSA